jgi:thioester reductase-like protein
MASGAVMDRRETRVVAGGARRVGRRAEASRRAEDPLAGGTGPLEQRGGDPARGGVLLTGATGFLGMELLARYLERTDRRVYALVRGADDREAAERLQGALRCLFGAGHPYGDRVVAVRGDLTRSRLGLRGRCDALAEEVSEIVHGAASVSFELGLQDARAVNVEGTRRVLELAERCLERGGLRRLSHISTAYVAGEHGGCFSEDDLDVGQRFRNAYEQSKFEAERLVDGWRGRLPITVLRPSIVVGERESGWTPSFNVLYWPLRAFARGAYLALPARRGAPVDVVPVDYVADAILHLSQVREAEGATFHLTAGAHVSSVGELVELARSFFERPAPRLLEPSVYWRVVHPLLLRSSRDERFRRALERSEIFFPYFATRVRYDDRRCRVALRGSGIAPPPLRSYFDRLVEFAVAAEWGRRPISRADARGTAASTGGESVQESSAAKARSAAGASAAAGARDGSAAREGLAARVSTVAGERLAVRASAAAGERLAARVSTVAGERLAVRAGTAAGERLTARKSTAAAERAVAWKRTVAGDTVAWERTAARESTAAWAALLGAR